MEKSKSTSNDGGGDEEYVAQREVRTHTAEKNSFDSVMNVGCGPCGSTDGHGKNEGKNRGFSGNTSTAESEKKNGEKTLMGCDNPTCASKHVEDTTMARAKSSVSPTVLPCDSGSMKQAHDGLLVVG